MKLPSCLMQKILLPRFLLALTLCLGPLALLRADDIKPGDYLTARHPDAATLLAPPPLPGSAEDAADMAAVVAVHKSCSTNDAAIAFSEKKFSIFTFSPAIGSFLRPGALPKTEAFFERVQKEAAAVTDTAKDYWKRPRPYTVDPSLASGKLEKSFSYPSGHATEGMVLALVLVELFPDKHDGILAIGRDIGWHRVWIARHYPTDIYAGRVFAQAIVREMKSNPAFKHDLAEAKSEVEAVQHASQTTTAAQRAAAN
jgi:acid phosphatase (class A)